MILLAEIADKMPTIAGLWFRNALLAFVITVFGVFAGAWRTWIGWLLALALAGFLAYIAYEEAYLGGDFSVAIWEELGARWVAHSLASAFMPLVVLFIVFAVLWVRRNQTAAAS